MLLTAVALISGFIVNKRQARVILELTRGLNESKIELAKAQTTASEAKESAEKERQTRLEMEKSLAPRTIPLVFGGGKSNIDPLKKFSGIEMIVEYLPDAECTRAAFNIVQLASMAGWKLVRCEPNLQIDPGLAFPEGVVVRPYSSDATSEKPPRDRSDEEQKNETRSNRAADALVEFLDSNNWDATKKLGWKANVPVNTVKISVGLKTLPYFEPKEFKEARDKAKQIERDIRKMGEP